MPLSWPMLSHSIGRVAIKDDLYNAGATWVDDEAIADGNLIASRTPKDLPAFCQAVIAPSNSAV